MLMVSQLVILLLPYYIGLGLACPRQLSSCDGVRITLTEYTSLLSKKLHSFECVFRLQLSRLAYTPF